MDPTNFVIVELMFPHFDLLSILFLHFTIIYPFPPMPLFNRQFLFIFQLPLSSNTWGGEEGCNKSFCNMGILVIVIYIHMKKKNSIKHVLIIPENIKNNLNQFKYPRIKFPCYIPKKKNILGNKKNYPWNKRSLKLAFRKFQGLIKIFFSRTTKNN